MEISLDKGQTYLNKESRRLKVKQGRVWITVEGDEEDYVLNEGECFASRANNNVVLQGLEQALISFDTE